MTGRLQAARRRIFGFLGVALVLGVLGGVVWWLVTPLATYTVGADGVAGTSERGLTAFFAGDAWFSVVGVVVGVALGVLAWRWFARLGWWVVPLVVIAGAAAAGLCLIVGQLLGPSRFDERLASAAPGSVVAIDLTLRAPTSLLVWVVAAVAPVLVGSSLGRDPEDQASAGAPELAVGPDDASVPPQ